MKQTDSFGTPDDVERHKTSCAIFNAQMSDGALVTDHVLYMIEMIKHLSVGNSVPKPIVSLLTVVLIFVYVYEL